ncbi:hypothetical protein [Phaeocystidibacter luteus]|uniref:Uncharacterized protein n=1 Tax=Phaeocystidibacter luteus TaxID=911197 RepID=A0A6N6RL41_9FLAO|nr:hypothetical protein [Phaeocystidibacter luteus]KAB2810342.1 hypothetical protein F8C67_07075 [Phaeocystidibacter luteus]
MKYIALLALALSIVSCNSKQEVPEEVETLHREVVDAYALLNELDSATIHESYAKVRPYYERLKTTDFDSTLKEVYIYDLTWMDRYQRAIHKWNIQLKESAAELKESISQLEDLKAVIQQGDLDSAEIAMYYEQERLAVQQFLDHTRDRAGEIMSYSKGVDSMKTRLDSIFSNLNE